MRSELGNESAEVEAFSDECRLDSKKPEVSASS